MSDRYRCTANRHWFTTPKVGDPCSCGARRYQEAPMTHPMDASYEHLELLLPGSDVTLEGPWTIRRIIGDAIVVTRPDGVVVPWHAVAMLYPAKPEVPRGYVKVTDQVRCPGA